eukprot:2303168-Heterocapsa_arctica.AAC.1
MDDTERHQNTDPQGPYRSREEAGGSQEPEIPEIASVTPWHDTGTWNNVERIIRNAQRGPRNEQPQEDRARRNLQHQFHLIHQPHRPGSSKYESSKGTTLTTKHFRHNLDKWHRSIIDTAIHEELLRNTGHPCGILTFTILNTQRIQDDGDLYQVKCKWSNIIANLIVFNSRKHHQYLDIPTSFDNWTPRTGQECR